MARKGNLLFNGDWETGTGVDWFIGEFGLDNDFVIEVTQEDKYQGNYGGKVTAIKDSATGYISYNKVCSFEEYEAYLLIGYIKMITTNKCQLYLYGLDDNGNYIDKYPIGFNSACGEWKRFSGILRGFGAITNFKVGFYIFASYEGAWAYFDNFKLLPLKSASSHRLIEEWKIDNLTSYYLTVLPAGVVGECRLESLLTVRGVSGSSPTLDTRIEVYYPPSYDHVEKINHSQFTNTGFERVSAYLVDGTYIWIIYNVGGSSPSFDITHQIRLIPLSSGLFSQSGTVM